MTFRGDKIIGEPTLAQVEIYVAEFGLFCEPQEAYDYWKKKGWMTKGGTEVKSLEAAVNVYNGIAVQRFNKGSKEQRDKRKKAKKKEQEIIKDTAKKKPYYLYKEQMKDQRWNLFRWFILKIRGEKCEVCGSTNNLQVHHTKYILNRFAWEYACTDVMVVCKECHKKLHGIN